MYLFTSLKVSPFKILRTDRLTFKCFFLFQSLMIRERVLGPAHPDTSYYIRYRGAVYADAGQFDRCITLWLYALNMQQVRLIYLSPFKNLFIGHII